MKFIQEYERKKSCIFCKAKEQTDGVENLIVFRSQRAFVILNQYPYTCGHLMIVPFEHKASLEELDFETRAELIELTTKAIQVLRSEYKPEGFNIGANIGDAAGAGIPKHFHLHIVPRWTGDTSFMTTLDQTRVLPETIEDTYKRIHETW